MFALAGLSTQMLSPHITSAFDVANAFCQLRVDKPDPACTGLWTSALQPLLAWAEDVVPRKHWEDTPLFLFGTAGLRVLTPESQSVLLSNIQNALQGSPFRSASLLNCTQQPCTIDYMVALAGPGADLLI